MKLTPITGNVKISISLKCVLSKGDVSQIVPCCQPGMQADKRESCRLEISENSTSRTVRQSFGAIKQIWASLLSQISLSHTTKKLVWRPKSKFGAHKQKQIWQGISRKKVAHCIIMMKMKRKEPEIDSRKNLDCIHFPPVSWVSVWFGFVPFPWLLLKTSKTVSTKQAEDMCSPFCSSGWPPYQLKHKTPPHTLAQAHHHQLWHRHSRQMHRRHKHDETMTNTFRTQRRLIVIMKRILVFLKKLAENFVTPAPVGYVTWHWNKKEEKQLPLWLWRLFGGINAKTCSVQFLMKKCSNKLSLTSKWQWGLFDAFFETASLSWGPKDFYSFWSQIHFFSVPPFTLLNTKHRIKLRTDSFFSGASFSTSSSIFFFFSSFSFLWVSGMMSSSQVSSWRVNTQSRPLRTKHIASTYQWQSC